MHSEGLTESWNHLLFWTLLYNNIRTLTWPGTYVSTYAWNGGDVFFFLYCTQIVVAPAAAEREYIIKSSIDVDTIPNTQRLQIAMLVFKFP